ncbi:DegT/DnrJ/EryC1/StrS family aminotransferase [Aliivibrio fischeri]|uniref:DegT/DnrJ/EryC1/StrS aminotransferase family protein n=1 Tax=Aliivibrio fischeri TaxID=668 RepID=UPI001F343663|nr:DegT/DnrJ/EryC1/StrS family aminotransferase [Aliivibrio fischeri]MCE7534922.1 DegT/DnrJ/EryC1/StrS family aminotransferase [Aliivibrio fischeri]MCE7559364.1 DegT/DnrJ/EryC1/StrS family aminotransferase [Aliivibrio fischeri]
MTNKKEWPKWPIANNETFQAIQLVLKSKRWTVTGPYDGKESYERTFSKMFASYLNIKYCTPVSSGTSGLLVALNGLDIGYGDEVLVPGLTWVACASATLTSGAKPIFVDIDPDNLAMCPKLAKKAITNKTKAIILVHPYCRVADIEEFVKLSKEFDLKLIEDCSQAHGAEWNNKKVGTFGDVGVFSMQQSKVLTSGEGGAVVTNSLELYEKFEQARCDGRVFTKNKVKGKLELMEKGEVLGSNYCMSEFHAAILCSSLSELDKQNKIRQQFVDKFTKEAALTIPEIEFLPLNARVVKPTYYNLVIKFKDNFCHKIDIEKFVNALSEKINAQVSPIYQPISFFKLYNPLISAKSRLYLSHEEINPDFFQLNNSINARKKHFTIPNWVLLDEEDGYIYLIKCIRYLLDNMDEVNNYTKLNQESF